MKILIAEDHPTTLDGTIQSLRQEYPDAEIVTASSVESLLAHLEPDLPDLVIMDISLPPTPTNTPEEDAKIEIGIECLRTLLLKYPTLNFFVQSSYITSLVRITHEIESHQGGFVTANKGLSTSDMLMRVRSAMQGFSYTRDIPGGCHMKPQWHEVLKLAFQEGLQDGAIAKQMHIAERTVRHYWIKIYDVLGICPVTSKQNGKNPRFLAAIKARELGLID